MTYAATTIVPVAKSKTEIETLLRKKGATSFGCFEEQHRAVLVFEMQERRIVFHLPLPARDEKQFRINGRGAQRTVAGIEAAWEQACRSRWRALYLCIKAKLEVVETGIETFEESFLAHVQMPDGHSVSEHVMPAIANAYKTGTMQPLLPKP